jgi:hypothetical protein
VGKAGGAKPIANAMISSQICDIRTRSILLADMRGCRLSLIALGLIVASCNPLPHPTASHDTNGDGHIDEWVYTVGKSEIKVALDANHDGRPDTVKTFRDGQLVKVERDRNFDGRVDLIENYDRGHMSRVVSDDNFDGKPDTVKTYRNGKLAIVEHDPDETGSVASADYYDENGVLIRTVTRGKSPHATPLPDKFTALTK